MAKRPCGRRVKGVVQKATHLRKQLVKVSLAWEGYFGVAPSITSAISELDATLLVGMKNKDYCACGKTRTAVTKDNDFIHKGIRYQVIANRPSGKKRSLVTLVSLKTEKKRPFGWERLIWILYDRFYVVQEAREFTAKQYRKKFALRTRLSPDDMRKGRLMYPRQ